MGYQDDVSDDEFRRIMTESNEEPTPLNVDTTAQDLFEPAPAPESAQPQLQPPPVFAPAEPPADAYSPELNIWYDEAAPGAPGAWYHKTIGWHFRVTVGHGASTSSAMNSSVSTPVNGQMNWPQLPPPTPVYVQLAMQPSGPYFQPAPQIQHGGYDFGNTSYGFTANVNAIPHQPAPLPTRAPAKIRRNIAAESSKKVSIKQTCTCREQPKGQKIPRARNMWILYRSYNSAKILDQNQQYLREGRKDLIIGQADISKYLATRWKQEPDSIRQVWADKAEREAQKHRETYPDYKYNPGSSKNARFGDEFCVCGAYQTNLEHARQKNPRRASKKSRTASAMSMDDGDLHSFDATAYNSHLANPMHIGMPSAEDVRQASIPTKRERSSASQQPVRRSPRNTRNQQVSYQEPAEERDTYGNMTIAQPFYPQQPTSLSFPTRPAPITTQPQPDSPAHNTRSRSQTPKSSLAVAFGSQMPKCVSFSYDTGMNDAQIQDFRELFEGEDPIETTTTDFDFDFADQYLNNDGTGLKTPQKKGSQSSKGSVVSADGRRKSVRIAQREENE